MEKNNSLNEEVRNLEREYEIQALKLCEEIELIKKVEEDRVMINEDQRSLTSRLEEKTSNL